jgi:DNA polymerase-3 subunit alpha
LKEDDQRVEDLLQVAGHLEGLVRHASTHAAGVVISPQPLQEMVPLYKSNKDEITTQYAMNDLEKIGLLKMDFLGLTTLTVIDDCVKLIETTRGEKLDLENLPVNDDASYAMLGKGLTAGIFQFESRGMTDILQRVKPTRLADLTALNALYRPGPLQGGMIDEYIARKTGKKRVSYDLPQLKEILEETYGVIVYQEQVIQIFNRVAGFTLGEADVVRRAMGKKKHEEMVANREKFLAGAKKNNVPATKAERLWELVEQFAGYGFNKSHSAAYALIAYQTAYLKTHYPVEFMSALLSSEIGNQDKLTQYLNECRDMNIPILPPDVNSSDLVFTPAGNSIRFGLTAIKNVGAAAIESVLAARSKLGRFDTLLQFCENVDLRLLNKRVIESLIKAGAFDSLGARRSQHMAVLDRVMDLGQKRQRETSSGQHGLFMGDANVELPPALDLPEVPDWTESERLTGEKEVLGFYVTGHPLEKYMTRLASITHHDSSSLEGVAHESPVTLGGILTGLRVRPSKKGDLWASGMLEDNRGSVELLIFPQAYQQFQGVLKHDAALLIKGRVRHEENQRTKVVVNEARPLEAAVNGPQARLRIRVNLAQAGESLSGELADLLAAHPGSNPVILELMRPGDFVATLRVSSPRAVQADQEVISQLQALPGVSAIQFEKGADGKG